MFNYSKLKKNKNYTYIIAEIGINHGGNLKVAMNLIRAASRTGVDAVKFQTYNTELRVKDRKSDLFNILKKFLLSQLKPHFTFLNVVNSQNMIDRLKKRKNLNRYDKFKVIFYKKVQKGYLALSKKNKKNYLVIDSNREINTNKKIILNKIIELTK